MKFFSPRHLPLVGLCLTVAACANAANRRALYYPTKPHGPWHDYDRRLVVAAQLGVSADVLPTPAPPPAPATLPGGRTRPGGVTTTTTTTTATGAALPQPRFDTPAAPPTQATLPPPSSTTEVLPPVPPSPAVAR